MKQYSVYVPSTTLLFSLIALLILFLQPSIFALFFFLICATLLGYRIAIIIISDHEIQLYASIGIGLAIVVACLLIPFGFLAELPIDSDSFIILMVVTSSVLLDVKDALRKEPERMSIVFLCRNILTALRETDVRLTFVLFILSFILRYAFQTFNSDSILPDAAMYFTAARELADNGIFSSNILNDVPITSAVSKVYGLVPRTGTWLLMSVFFSFGGSSLATLKIMLAVLGSVIVFPAAGLAKKWFKENWWIGCSIVALHPVLVFFSSVPFGPEIASLFFGVYGLMILETNRTDGPRLRGFLLAGLFWGISLIAWDPNAIQLFIVPYALYGIFNGRDKVSGIISLFLAMGLGIVILLSLTWFVQPIFVTMALLICCLVFVKRKSVLQITGMFLVISTFFTIWLNRWYLYPELVIEPSLDYESRTTPIDYISGGILTLSTLDNTTLFIQMFLFSVTLFIAAMAFLAILLVRRTDVRGIAYPLLFLVVHAGFSILYFVPERGLLLDFGAARIFLGSIFFSSLLSGYAIARFSRFLLWGDSFGKTQTAVHSFQNADKIAIIAIIMLLVPGTMNFYQVYGEGLDYMQYVDYPSFMGVNDSKTWILENTLPGDIFLVASGQTSRIWAMSIENRLFASLYVEQDGDVIPYTNVTLWELVQEASSLNASFIIFDPMIKPFHLDKLIPLYDNAASDDIGIMIPVISDNVTLNQIAEGAMVDTLTPQYVNGLGTSKVIIFELSKESSNMTWGDDFDEIGDWNVFLNGTINTSGSNLDITRDIGSTKAYAEYVFIDEINVTANSAIIIRVSHQDMNTRSGFYLRFYGGEKFYQTFDDSGIYIFMLNAYQGLEPELIILYNLSAGDASNETELVSYDWISLLNFI